MRIILAVAAATLLAACSQGKWQPEDSTLSFSFDTTFIERTFSPPDGPKAMAPALRPSGQVADDSVKPTFSR